MLTAHTWPGAVMSNERQATAAPTWPHVHVHVMQVPHVCIKPAAGAVKQAGGVQGLGVQGHSLRLHGRPITQNQAQAAGAGLPLRSGTILGQPSLRLDVAKAAAGGVCQQ